MADVQEIEAAVGEDDPLALGAQARGQRTRLVRCEGGPAPRPSRRAGAEGLGQLRR